MPAEPKATAHSRFKADAMQIIADLREMRLRIDALGDLSTNAAKTDRVEMLACFASNTLYGTQALIEQMRFVVTHPRAKRAVWP